MMNKIRITLLIGFIMISPFSFASGALGSGLSNSLVGTKAISVGAFSGIADDASAVYHNPSGLVFNDNKVFYVELYEYTSFNRFRYTANSIEDESDPIYFTPGSFSSYRMDNIAFGFGVYIPYGGGGTQYENFQNSGHDLDYVLGLIAFTPAVAYKLLPKLSLGASLSLYYGTMTSKVFDPDMNMDVKSDYSGVAGFGGSIGILYLVTDDVKVGFVVKKDSPIKIDGTTKIGENENDAEVEFTLPYIYTLGFGYNPNEKLALGLDFRYELWSQTDEIKFKVAGAENNSPTYYKDCWVISLGADYQIATKLAVMAGLKYSQSAAKDEGLSPASVPVDSLIISLGGAYGVTDYAEINIAGVYNNGFEKEYNSQKFDRDTPMFLIGFKLNF